MSGSVTSHPPDDEVASPPLQGTDVRQGAEEMLQGRAAQLAVGDRLTYLP